MTHNTPQASICRTRRVSVGRLDAGYGPVLAHVIRDLLSELAPDQQRPALVGHTASVPVVHVLEKFTKWSPLFAFDPRPEHVTYQRSRIRDERRVRMLHCPVTELPSAVDGIAMAVNPFGLQEFPGEEETYARAVRQRSTDDALLVTMDWGTTSYPESIAHLPGVSDEIAFSERSQLVPFEAPSGWRLVDEVSYEFYFTHTGEQVAGILPAAKAARFQEVVEPNRIIEIGSSVIVRRYLATSEL